MSIPAWILLALALALYGIALYRLWRRQHGLMFPGDGERFGLFDELDAMNGRAVAKEALGQQIRYYFVPAKGPSRGLVLLFHGNRHGARERFAFAQRLAPLGHSVMLAEYPGYAGDAATASQDLFLRNALAMADEAETLAGGAPIFYYGESLGSGVATFLAMRRPPKGLLLSTPWPSMVAVAVARFFILPLQRLVRHPFPAWRWAPHVTCPVLILHGEKDRTIPLILAQMQARNFPSPPELRVFPETGHADLRDRDPRAYWGAVEGFLDRCLSA